MTNKIKIMIVAAELTAKDSEAALMQTRLAAAPLCNYYETHVIRAAKPSEVIGEAASLQPDVIHFCGNLRGFGAGGCRDIHHAIRSVTIGKQRGDRQH